MTAVSEPAIPCDARRLDEDLWVFERPLRVLGLLQVGTRMTVIRLADGGLFLHSPVAPDPPTRRALDALGPVRFVVAPSKFHHLFVGAYRDAYPEAKLYAAPGLPEKRRDLRFDAVLGERPPETWGAEIDQRLFPGARFLNEVVFHHRKSR